MIEKLVKILRATENVACLRRADELESEVSLIETLSLRGLDLKSNDITAIATILKEANNDAIKSISFSYNKLIGDIGATELARSLPLSICELGLVGCGIGDEGGIEVLNWMKDSSNLKMICMEQNHFSDKLKMDYNLFRKQNPEIMVVI